MTIKVIFQNVDELSQRISLLNEILLFLCSQRRHHVTDCQKYTRNNKLFINLKIPSSIKASLHSSVETCLWMTLLLSQFCLLIASTCLSESSSSSVKARELSAFCVRKILDVSANKTQWQITEISYRDRVESSSHELILFAPSTRLDTEFLSYCVQFFNMVSSTSCHTMTMSHHRKTRKSLSPSFSDARLIRMVEYACKVTFLIEFIVSRRWSLVYRAAKRQPTVSRLYDRGSQRHHDWH